MHANSKLVSLILLGGSITLQGCDQSITVDTSGGDIPPAGVIEGTVSYVGPPPCSQAGHIVGNVVILVFDARNPPPPTGLGNTAINFGVVSGDVLFHDWPATQGAAKLCPAAGDATQTVSASYTIAPMAAGQYLIQAFFDYTNDFFATFKFRNLPEQLDVGGGYIDIDDATKLVPGILPPQTLADGGLFYPLAENQSDPNYLPIFLPVNIGTPGPTPPTSLWDVPAFTMPDNGYVATGVTVTIASELGLARPYFYPAGVTPAALSSGSPLSTITVNSAIASSDIRPPASSGGSAGATPQNPTGAVDYIPVLSFPQDLGLYAQPSAGAVTQLALGATTGRAVAALSDYQSAFPQIKLQAGVPLVEQKVAADTISATDPFHMQLGLPNAPAGAAPGGNGGIYVWWNGSHKDEDCKGIPGCSPALLDYIPESGLVLRMWPLVVLAKLEDLTSGSQPNANDIGGLIPQGTDLTKPAIIIQGITLAGDSFAQTTLDGPLLLKSQLPLAYPDPSNLADHVTVMLRPSTLCLDPRAPDHGGVLVAPGTITNGNIMGPFAPGDTAETTTTGTVVASSALSNPSLARLVNHNAAGATNGLIGACLPTGRYQINLVYPTGQAWTTPNEEGSCAGTEGNSIFANSPFDPGSCSAKPRPVLYSQGTRAVVEITASTTGNCTTASTSKVAPVPFACTSLCPDPNLDPTTSPAPCSACLDPTLNPNTTPPCTSKLATAPDAGH